MDGVTSEIFVSATLILIVIFVFSLLFSVLIIYSKSPHLLKKLNEEQDSSNWPLFRPGKYDPGRLGLGFIFYFIVTPANKMKNINNSMFMLNLLAKLSLIFALLLIVVNLFFYYS